MLIWLVPLIVLAGAVMPVLVVAQRFTVGARAVSDTVRGERLPD